MSAHSLPLPVSRADAQLVARAGICAALAGAALIHGTVVSEHFALWPAAGVFFLGTQLVEVSLALAAFYVWNRRTAQLVFATSVATVLVWLVSRTFGMPIGPAAFRVPEAIGVPDLACCILELGAAALAAPRAFSPRSTTGRSAASAAGRSLAVALVVVLVAVIGWGLRPGVTQSPTRPLHSHSAP